MSSSTLNNLSHPTSTSQNPLQTLLNTKRAELQSLLQLRDLSTQLATQIETLGVKISTLDNGFEAVSEVMGNWGAVLRVLGMVGQGLSKGKSDATANGDANGAGSGGASERPQTLVRIPVDVTAERIEGLVREGEGPGTTTNVANGGADS